jgi:phage terminase small subunit
VALTKPKSVENDAFKNAKWDEIVQGRSFCGSDVSMLTLLCQWYKIAHQAENELEDLNDQTAYPSENGDLKPLPQISTLKTASGEIRALNKQLGIVNREDKEITSTKHEATKLEIIQNRRNKKARKTA